MSPVTDFRELPDVYSRTVRAVAAVVQDEISARFDHPSNELDISIMFYKIVVREVAKAAVASVGVDKAKSVFRQVAREMQ